LLPTDAKVEEPLALTGAGYNPDLARPWFWVPTLYFVQGLPYVLVVSVSVVLYQNLNLSTRQIAEYTSYLGLPWVLKPLWSPLVDVLGSKRRWIVNTQFLMSVALAAVAVAVTGANFVELTLAGFLLLALCSATHDIAADGFYMQALTAHDQTFFVGIRNTAWRLAMVAATGLLVVFVGILHNKGTDMATAWRIGMLSTAGVMFFLSTYHAVVLPHPDQDRSQASLSMSHIAAAVIDTVKTFFAKPGLGVTLAFLLFYRFAEGQVVKIVQPFLLADRAVGGLGLTNVDVGWAYGIVGVALLLAGGVLGGVTASRFGLRRCLPWMVAAMNLPNVVYLALAFWQPVQMWAVNLAVGIEQFGYGFGFAAYMLYMLYVSRGDHETAHYALCTGFMALGMLIPGWFSGRIEEALGFTGFFAWVMIATIPSFLVAAWVYFRVDPEFGRREQAAI
jgi:MFS transporter, PAT family, beta-lactamase induction signal transducer AmpG